MRARARRLLFEYVCLHEIEIWDVRKSARTTSNQQRFIHKIVDCLCAHNYHICATIINFNILIKCLRRTNSATKRKTQTNKQNRNGLWIIMRSTLFYPIYTSINRESSICIESSSLIKFTACFPCPPPQIHSQPILMMQFKISTYVYIMSFCAHFFAHSLYFFHSSNVNIYIH